MAVQPKPEGYHTITTYLVVSKAARLIDFLKAAFDAEELNRSVTSDGRIRHAEVKIGDSRLMIGDASNAFRPMPAMLHLYVEDADTLYQRAIAAGATSLRAPADQFYGDRIGGVQDASGNQWWIATHIEDVSPEEMARREAALVGQ